ncbi:MAG TPA: dienelactone hydrolase family protein [Acidimicrobiales bacterium]
MASHVGDLVEFPADGGTGRGYLAPAVGGAGLGVVVIQEGSGLDRHSKDLCGRLAAEGITALAVGADAATAPELTGAVDYLLAHPAVRGHTVAVVGFGAGGGLALWLATLRPDAVAAAVPFYGPIPSDGARPDYSRLAGAVEVHYADDGVHGVQELEDTLTDLGKEVRVFHYPGTQPAFFDDTRADVYDEDAARVAWVRILEFLRAKLG